MKSFRNLILAGVALLIGVIAIEARATVPDALGGSAFPLTMISTPPINLTDGFNEMLQIINAQTVGISTVYSGAISVPSAGVDSSGVTSSTNLQGNPLVQITNQVVTTASANAGVVLLASQTGRVIHPAGLAYVTASGTASGATSVQIICSGGLIIETLPIAELITQVPAPIFTSNTTTLASSFTTGCPSGQAIMVSNSGTLVSTTSMIVQMPYYVQ